MAKRLCNKISEGIKETDKQDNKSHQEATVSGKEDTGGNLALEVQSKKAADNGNDSSATKRLYDEISQGEKETTDENKSKKGKKAKKTPDVPVHSLIPFPMITEDKDANTIDKQD